jgi:hypothetical protein
MRILVSAVVASALGATAGAGVAAADEPLDLPAVVADIDTGGGPALVASLRPRLAGLDDAGRCALGLAYAGPAKQRGKRAVPTAGDRTRALLYLPSCGGDLPTAIATHAGAVRDRLVALAERAGDSRLELVAAAPIAVDVDRFPGDVARAPSTFYLPAGDYLLTAHLPDGSRLIQQLALARGTPASVLFELPPPPVPSTEPTQVDFEGAEPEATYAGAPPKHKHGSLIGGKFGKGLEANRKVREAAVAGEREGEREPIDDGDHELRVRRIVVPAPSRSGPLLVRAGVGVADSATGDSLAFLVGTGARAAIAPRFAIDGRLDVIRRGSHTADDGTMTPGVWTAGVGAALRWWPWVAAPGTISTVAGVRGDLHRVFDADTELGATVTAGVALHLGSDRVTIEVRGEQSVTELAGSRPRMVVLELGLR